MQQNGRLDTMHQVQIDTCYYRALARYHRVRMVVGVLIPRECQYRLNDMIVFNGQMRFKILRITATDISSTHNVVYIQCM